MPDIKIDLGQLADLQRELSTIAMSFASAEQMSQSIADHVGHNGLESAVRDFAGKWSVHREHIEQKMGFVLEATNAVHDTFVELDSRMTKQALDLGSKFSSLQVSAGD